MFKTPLILQALPEPDKWIVYRPLVWGDVLGDIVVPEGFETDLASIPRILRNVPALDPNGVSRRAAVLHDYLYTLRTMPKDKADTLLFIALRAEGADILTAQAFYNAVSLFGGESWAKDQGKS